MERKEPYATQEEFDKYVVHYEDVPLMELAPGINVHFVSAEKLSIFFSIMEPNSMVPVHQHEAEQFLVVAEGAGELTADGKLYHLEKGDVFAVPSNMPHGLYVSDKGCRTIEVFAPPRRDYEEKLAALKKSLQK